MRKVSLPTKRSFSWKTYLVLTALITPAAFAIVPFALSMQSEALAQLDLPIAPWVAVSIDVGVNLFIAILLGGVGLWMAGRIGLGLPFIEGWARKRTRWERLPGVLGAAILTGILVGLAILLVDTFIFNPPLERIVENMETALPGSLRPPAWQGLLAAISAGITEETMFRLFGLTLLAWLGGLLFHDREGRPRLAVLWAANILFAVAFGLAHLPATASLGLPLNALVISRAIVLNGLGGVAFGWLYWTYGLESAMVAHFSTDVVLHVLLTWVLMQGNQTFQIALGAILLLVLAVAARFSWRAVRQDIHQTEILPDDTRLSPPNTAQPG